MFLHLADRPRSIGRFAVSDSEQIAPDTLNISEVRFLPTRTSVKGRHCGISYTSRFRKYAAVEFQVAKSNEGAGVAFWLRRCNGGR